jgi:hypothetical protein
MAVATVEVDTVEVDTVMVVGMAMVATGDMDIGDMVVGMAMAATGDIDIGDTAVLIFVHIPMGIGVPIIIHMVEVAGCRDIGNMVIGFPVIMCLAIKKYGTLWD